MLLYQTDDNGFWTGETVEARLSPREVGVYLIPRGCIAEPPPDLAENELARWIWAQEAWEVVEIQPEITPVIPPSRLSFLEFMDLFTNEEQLALAGAAMTDAPTKLWYDRAVGAQFIALDDERLAEGLDAMVLADIIPAARKTRVLQGLPPE